MKKGQGPIGIIAGLTVMIFLLIVIAWAFWPKTTTGQVVSGIPEDEKNNFIAEPFNLKAWIFNAEGVQVDIQNSGNEDYLVKSVEVKGCGVTDYGRELKKGESELFPIKCGLSPGEKFSGILIVTYSSADGTTEMNAFGNVEDVV